MPLQCRQVGCAPPRVSNGLGRMTLFAIWLILALASIPWAMVRARKQGYSMGLWCVLALVFGFLAVAATYLLPKKERHESFGEAAGRSVTAGAITAGQAVQTTARAQAPGLAA